ncbi:MAG: hypothetical protein HOJ33_00025 [Gammaproteobacteria bacterium]|nr:hypothetical protein [Gammaproteobacteria bacterium]
MMTNIDYNKIFTPELSPKEMLELGVFGGYYFKDDISEFPKSWFKNAKVNTVEFDINMNYFNIKSGLSIDHWIAKNWIFAEDPIGWFQWYCRYSMGRRVPEMDKIQIMRWKAFGPRHKGAIKKNCNNNDFSCRPRQRQGLLQWAYDPFF